MPASTRPDAYAARLRANGATGARRAALHTTGPRILVLARPYHMDPGIGHEIEVDLQAYGYPVLWTQYLPTDADLLNWMFGPDIDAAARSGIRSTSPMSGLRRTARTPTRFCGRAKFAARMPWITCVVRLSSYECGMDQPTYTPVQQHRRAIRYAVLLVPGSRLDEACRFGEDPHRDNRPLPGEVFDWHHCGQESRQSCRVSVVTTLG